MLASARKTIIEDSDERRLMAVRYEWKDDDEDESFEDMMHTQKKTFPLVACFFACNGWLLYYFIRFTWMNPDQYAANGDRFDCYSGWNATVFN